MAVGYVALFPDGSAHGMSGAGKINPGHTVFQIHEVHLSLTVGFGVGFSVFSAIDVTKCLVKMWYLPLSVQEERK